MIIGIIPHIIDLLKIIAGAGLLEGLRDKTRKREESEIRVQEFRPHTKALYLTHVGC